MLTLNISKTKYISFYNKDYLISYPIEKVSGDTILNLTISSKQLDEDKVVILSNNLSEYEKYYKYNFIVEDFGELLEGLYDYIIKDQDGKLKDAGVLYFDLNDVETIAFKKDEPTKIKFKK